MVPETPIYAVAFDASGKLLAAAGGDGLIRMIDAATGKIVRQFSAAPISARRPQKSSTRRACGGPPIRFG